MDTLTQVRTSAELDERSALSYDPLKLMPAALPGHPRVLVTPEQLARSRSRIGKVAWATRSFERLLAAADEPCDLPAALPTPIDAKLNAGLLTLARRNALAHLLTGEAKHLDRAIAMTDLLARDYPTLPIAHGSRALGSSLGETRYTSGLAHLYDMLAATGLDNTRDAAYRAMLEATHAVTDANPHYNCGNHNTWNLQGRLAVGAALGDMQIIHDALYGWRCPQCFRYGLAHQLQHDFLADGFHWERAPGYHMYTLMGMTEAALIMHYLGVNLLTHPVPALMSPDSEQDSEHARDLHRAYGPEGERTLLAAWHAIYYSATAAGDLSLLHDSGTANLDQLYIWGPVLEFGYDMTGDETITRMIGHVEQSHPDAQRETPGLPMCLQTHHGEFDWVRLEHDAYPQRALSYGNDARFGQTGRHEGGCTLFDAWGAAVLRSDPADRAAPAAFCFYGPHSAGHQSPAALHVDLFGPAGRASDAPHSGGYGDANHLTWVRTTIAHNTITVDQQSMFPYDHPTESIWEADNWRDRPSDGELLLFQPEAEFKALRAINVNVYPGVRLDRTLIVTRQYVVDVYRALSEAVHTYDWAMHVVGCASGESHGRAHDLGEARGYMHLTNARAIDATGELSFAAGEATTRCRILPPTGGQVILADAPRAEGKKKAADKKTPARAQRKAPCLDRTALLVRTEAAQALFVSVWRFDDAAIDAAVQGAAEGDVAVTIDGTAWHLPIDSAMVRQAR